MTEVPQETDEFDTPRERIERHPTILDYWRSRTDDQIVEILAGGNAQRNVFGTYSGTRGEHLRNLLRALRERALQEAEADVREHDSTDVEGDPYAEGHVQGYRSARDQIAESIRDLWDYRGPV